MNQIHRAVRRMFLAGAAVLLATPALQAQTLPAAHDVVERYIAAIGGRAHLHAFNTRHQLAEMSVQGMTMTMETFQARPNKILTRMEMAGMGSMSMGYDGTTAWANNPMTGPRVITGGELPQVLMQADMDASLDPVRSFPTMQTIGESTAAGRPCWNVRMVHTSGQEVQQCFDKESGLLVGATAHQTTPQGDITVNMTFENYQEFDGMKVPTRVSTSAAGQDMVITVKSLSHEAIPDSTFALPAEIRALTAGH